MTIKAITTHRPIVRMPDEIECDDVVSGSSLRIVGRFTWVPNKQPFNMERVASGVCYRAETPTKVREILESYMGGRSTRLSLNYGDTTTGEDWLDEWMMEGYISHSTGPLRSPLLIANSRSMGGGAILDQCIVRIKFAQRSLGYSDLYRHPNYFADREKHRRAIPDAATEERVWRRRFA